MIGSYNLYDWRMIWYVGGCVRSLCCVCFCYYWYILNCWKCYWEFLILRYWNFYNMSCSIWSWLWYLDSGFCLFDSCSLILYYKFGLMCVCRKLRCCVRLFSFWEKINNFCWKFYIFFLNRIRWCLFLMRVFLWYLW